MKRHQLARRRKAIGLSQERLAEAVGVDRTTVVRWENGDTAPQPWHRPKMAQALQVTLEQLDDLLTTAVGPGPSTVVLGHLPPAVSNNEVDDLETMQSFRLADRQVGGGHLYATVTGYLQHAMAPRLFGHGPTADTSALFTAAAGLTEMAGWMAHDAGRDELAEQHFHRALGLATAGQDHQLGAHVLASLSHLSHHGRRPAQAITYARQGRERLRTGQPHSGVEARLLAMEARGHAALQDDTSCTATLRMADHSLGSSNYEVHSPWVSDFDQASLAAEAARCFRPLGHLHSAKTYAERVVAMRSADRPRSRAFAQLMLVDILVAQGEIEEACAVAKEVVEATRSVSSYLIIAQLEELRGLLTPHRRNPDVAAFVRSLREELNRRRAQQWIVIS